MGVVGAHRAVRVARDLLVVVCRSRYLADEQLANRGKSRQTWEAGFGWSNAGFP